MLLQSCTVPAKICATNKHNKKTKWRNPWTLNQHFQSIRPYMAYPLFTWMNWSSFCLPHLLLPRVPPNLPCPNAKHQMRAPHHPNLQKETFVTNYVKITCILVPCLTLHFDSKENQHPNLLSTTQHINRALNEKKQFQIPTFYFPSTENQTYSKLQVRHELVYYLYAYLLDEN